MWFIRISRRTRSSSGTWSIRRSIRGDYNINDFSFIILLSYYLSLDILVTLLRRGRRYQLVCFDFQITFHHEEQIHSFRWLIFTIWMRREDLYTSYGNKRKSPPYYVRYSPSIVIVALLMNFSNFFIWLRIKTPTSRRCCSRILCCADPYTDIQPRLFYMRMKVLLLSMFNGLK